MTGAEEHQNGGEAFEGLFKGLSKNVADVASDGKTQMDATGVEGNLRPGTGPKQPS